MDDLISVIVLVYRVEQYLDKAVQSILSQTYTNLEIILVDDGSDDSCPTMCDTYARKDSRVKVIHKKNGGIDDARKAGISAATGKYVGYVDGDDWIEPEMFEKLHKYMVENDVKVVESGIIDSCGSNESYRYPTFDEGKYTGEKFEKEIEPYMLYSGKFYRLGIMASLCNKIFDRELLTKYQMLPDPSDNIVDDTMVSIPCVAEAKSIYITHKSYYHYRVRKDSVKHTSRFDFLEKIVKSYGDWKSRFKYAKKESNLDYQIDMYLMYILLSKCPGVFDVDCSYTVMQAYGGISANSKVIVYGAGAAGIQLANYAKNIFKDNFVLWTDKNYKNFDEEANVKNPNMILKTEYDYILVGILWYEKAESAIKDLINLGVSRDKIKWICNDYVETPRKLLDNIF